LSPTPEWRVSPPHGSFDSGFAMTALGRDPPYPPGPGGPQWRVLLPSGPPALLNGSECGIADPRPQSPVPGGLGSRDAGVKLTDRAEAEPCGQGRRPLPEAVGHLGTFRDLQSGPSDVNLNARKPCHIDGASGSPAGAGPPGRWCQRYGLRRATVRREASRGVEPITLDRPAHAAQPRQSQPQGVLHNRSPHAM
jgi:hypothetical protein